MDTFGKLMSKLFKAQEMFPDMDMLPVYTNYGQSHVVITIPVTDENAQLLIDAQEMFAPAE